MFDVCDLQIRHTHVDDIQIMHTCANLYISRNAQAGSLVDVFAHATLSTHKARTQNARTHPCWHTPISLSLTLSLSLPRLLSLPPPCQALTSTPSVASTAGKCTAVRWEPVDTGIHDVETVTLRPRISGRWHVHPKRFCVGMGRCTY